MNCESAGSFQRCLELCWGGSEVPSRWAARGRVPEPWPGFRLKVRGFSRAPLLRLFGSPSSSTACKLQNLDLAHSFLVAARACAILPAMFNLVKDSRRPSRAIPYSATCHPVTCAQHGTLPASAPVQLRQPPALLRLRLPNTVATPPALTCLSQGCPPCCPASESSPVLFLPSSAAAYGGWACRTHCGVVAGSGSPPIPT